MSLPRIVRKSVEEEGKQFTVIVIEFINAIIAVFFEGKEERMGTVAVAIPRSPQHVERSAALLGYRGVELARVLAEFLASRLNKMVLCSINLSEETESYAGKHFMKLAQLASGEFN